MKWSRSLKLCTTIRSLHTSPKLHPPYVPTCTHAPYGPGQIPRIPWLLLCMFWKYLVRFFWFWQFFSFFRVSYLRHSLERLKHFFSCFSGPIVKFINARSKHQIFFMFNYYSSIHVQVKLSLFWHELPEKDYLGKIIQKISEYNLMRNNSQRRSLTLSATYIYIRLLLLYTRSLNLLVVVLPLKATTET